MAKLLFSFLILTSFSQAYAQVTYSITGAVKHLEDGVLPAATIFLNGTERKTYSGENGEFKLDGISPGSYQRRFMYSILQ
ncbi:MAG: hypothetical protein WKF66_14685 [Pedobacter sp.]